MRLQMVVVLLLQLQDKGYKDALEAQLSLACAISLDGFETRPAKINLRQHGLEIQSKWYSSFSGQVFCCAQYCDLIPINYDTAQ